MQTMMSAGIDFKTPSGAQRWSLLAGAAILVAVLCLPAHAACPTRFSARAGDTPETIARACGLNVEALKSINPGMRSDEPILPGTTIRVPRSAITSPMLDIGRGQVRVNPPTIPSVPGPSGSTVILPPELPPVPPQLVLPGPPPLPGQVPGAFSPNNTGFGTTSPFN